MSNKNLAIKLSSIESQLDIIKAIFVHNNDKQEKVSGLSALKGILGRAGNFSENEINKDSQLQEKAQEKLKDIIIK